jgi:hypothetical protein
LRKTSSKLQDNEKYIVDYERPFTAITICCKTEDDGTDGSEHKHKSDTPCNVGFRFAKCLGEVSDREGNSEKIKSIPGLVRVSIQIMHRVYRHTHAVNPTKKKSHCFPLSIARRVNGFGALFIGGLRVVIRVLASISCVSNCYFETVQEPGLCRQVPRARGAKISELSWQISKHVIATLKASKVTNIKRGNKHLLMVTFSGG